MRRASLFGLLMILTTVVRAPALRESSEGAVYEWPQFRGPHRDNVSRETGLMKRWPLDGPRLLWTAKGIGEGFSTGAVAHGLIYTTGNVDNETIITALELSAPQLLTTADSTTKTPMEI